MSEHNEHGISQPDDLHKVGNLIPEEHLAEVIHLTWDGEEIKLGGFINDPDNEDSTLATIYRFDRKTGEVATEHGRIIGNVREASEYIWEHRKGAVTVASFAITVALGSLWARHKSSK